MKIKTTIMALLAAAIVPFAASTALAGSGCCPGGGSKSGDKGGAKETSVFQVNCSSEGSGCGGGKGKDA